LKAWTSVFVPLKPEKKSAAGSATTNDIKGRRRWFKLLYKLFWLLTNADHPPSIKHYISEGIVDWIHLA
jgi:hypothetical protein